MKKKQISQTFFSHSCLHPLIKNLFFTIYHLRWVVTKKIGYGLFWCKLYNQLNIVSYHTSGRRVSYKSACCRVIGAANIISEQFSKANGFITDLPLIRSFLSETILLVANPEYTIILSVVKRSRQKSKVTETTTLNPLGRYNLQQKSKP